jgi:hypothetical protein
MSSKGKPLGKEAERAARAREGTSAVLRSFNLERDIERNIETFAERERSKASDAVLALAQASAEDFERWMSIVRHARKMDRSERPGYVARLIEADIHDYVERLAASAASRSRPCGSCSRLTETATCGECWRKPHASEGTHASASESVP